MRNLIVLPLVLLVAPPVFAERAATDLATRCTESQLAKLGLAELRLLRNEVYARHGRVFKDPLLQETFTATDWYRPDPAYRDARLTAVDKRCIALIKSAEDAVAKRQKQELGSQHLDDVANIEQFGPLTPAHLAALGRNGFVVAPAQHEQLFNVYEMNDYLNAPSFITPDPILQLYHMFFDMTLRQVESERLYGRLKKMLATLGTSHARLAKEAKQASVRAAAERNLGYLAVAAGLLKEKAVPFPANLKAAVAKEQKLIAAHGGWKESPLLKTPIDYSQFIPRGHYTRSETLRRFFLAMMWLGQPPFLLARSELVLQTLLFCHLMRETGADKDWQAIYDVTAFYVGVADDLSPLDVYQVAGAIFGTVKSPDDYADTAKLAKLRTELEKRYHPRIVPIPPPPFHIGPHVRLLGQRYIPDSEMLQRLSDPDRRPIPKGLDVMAVLGSLHARSILLERFKEAAQWPEYPKQLQKLATEFSRWDEKAWQTTLYTGWLWVLQGLLDRGPQPQAPAFMQSNAWAAKNLSTSLASWAELRHDTILFAKPSGAECGGGDEPPPPPESYVEPQIVFYTRLGQLLQLTESGLRKYDALPPSLVAPFKEMGEMCAFLKGISEKELAGKRRTAAELDQLKIFGANLERLTLAFIDPNATHWDEIVSPADRHMAVVADVHSSGGNALEEGVGPAYEILVLVPRRAGGRLLARGAVFSYFEFLHPMSDRLTDEKWQEMLKKKQTPPLPVWTDEFMVPVPIPPPRKGTAVYSSGC